MASIISGTITVASAGTAIRFTTVPTPLRSIEIYAIGGNTGDVYVGDSSVDNTDIPTVKGNGFSLLFRSTKDETPGDLSDLYLDAANTGDKIAYRAIAL
jgi:hypothetical protein